VGVGGGEDDLGEKAVDADADYFAGDLVTAADLAEALARLYGGFGGVFGEERL